MNTLYLVTIELPDRMPIDRNRNRQSHCYRAATGNMKLGIAVNAHRRAAAYRRTFRGGRVAFHQLCYVPSVDVLKQVENAVLKELREHRIRHEGWQGDAGRLLEWPYPTMSPAAIARIALKMVQEYPGVKPLDDLERVLESP